jgi:hypothetical protein
VHLSTVLFPFISPTGGLPHKEGVKVGHRDKKLDFVPPAADEAFERHQGEPFLSGRASQFEGGGGSLSPRWPTGGTYKPKAQSEILVAR